MKKYIECLRDALLGVEFNSYARHIRSAGHYIGIVPIYVAKALLGERTTESFCIDYNIPTTTNTLDANLGTDTLLTFNEINITAINSDKDEYTRCVNAYDKYLLGLGYAPNDAAMRFMAQHNVDARFYINTSSKRSVVITDDTSAYGICLITSLIPILVPWFFETDKPLTDNERRLLLTLLQDSPNGFYDWMETYIKSLDLRASMIKKKLEGFTSRFKDNKTDALENEIENIDRKISEYEQLIDKLFVSRENKVNELSGFILNSSGEEDTSLIDFFIASKSLNLTSVYRTNLSFEIKTTLDNYDPDVFDRYMKNENSPFNQARNYVDTNLDDGRMLVRAIFEEQKVKVNMKAAFTINFESGSISIDQDYTHFTDGCLPNPHLTAFRCLGNNEAQLRRAIREKDWIMALSTCISVAGNLNVSEANNDTNFLYYLFSSTNKCIKLPDGTDVTVADAIEWLKKGEANE